MEPISIFFDYIVKNEINEVKKYIEDKTVDINCQDSEGVTGLCVACYHERFEIVKYLCEKGIDALIASSHTGSTCLHYAIRTNNYEIIDYLVKYNNKLVNVRSKNGDSPLMFACVEGNYDVISLLLSEKADVTCVSNNKLTAYHCLIQRKRNDKDICDILKLMKSCDDSEIIFSCNGIGNTILHLCAERNYKNCIEYLLSLKFPERIRNKSGKVALDLCKGECRKILLESWNKENEIFKDSGDDIIKDIENDNPVSLNPKSKNNSYKRINKKKSHSYNNRNNKTSESIQQKKQSHSYSPTSPSPPPPAVSIQQPPPPPITKSKSTTELPKSPSFVIQPQIVMNDNNNINDNEESEESEENEKISKLMEDNIPNCSILDIHYKHIFGKDINELSISQLESLESFHLQMLKNVIEHKSMILVERTREEEEENILRQNLIDRLLNQ